MINYVCLTWNLLEELDRLMHGLVGLIDGLLHLLRVDGGQRIVHPGLRPALPVRGGDPQVSIWLKVLDKLCQLFVLK